MQDIQYTDIDYMEDKKDFTYDKVKFADLPTFADYLHEKGQRYILILVKSSLKKQSSFSFFCFTCPSLMSVCLCPQDPAVATSKRAGNMPYEAYDRGNEKNAWVTESDGKTPLLGEVMSFGC